MIDLFYNLFPSYDNNKKFLTKIHYYAIIRILIYKISNIIIPLYFLFTNKKYKHKSKRNNSNQTPIIISLTSFPARINKLWIVIETLLRQSYKADLIILWLSKKQFKSLDSLPKRLKEQQQKGLIIRFVEEDIRSHKKYLYTIKEYPNCILVTADDDLIYKSNWLESMIDNHYLYPDSIICNYGHQITYDKKGNIEKYNNWQEAKTDSKNVFFGSGGGVLFPPNSFHTDITKIDLALKLCPIADDIWLNTMVRLNSKQIIKITDNNILLPIINKENIALSQYNVTQNQNDIQLLNIISYYQKTININPFIREK